MSDEQRRINILEGPLRKTVLVLALPVLGEQLLNSFVGIFDTFLAGRISAEATSAIGLAAYVSWLVSMLFGLVGTGTNALVARFWGGADFGQARKVTSRSVSLAVVVGIVCTIFINLAAPTFASLQNFSGETYDITVRYLRIDTIGYIFSSMTLVGLAALRGAGDMRSPMLILLVVNVINVSVSSCLVFGIGPFEPKGVDGIVIGTVAARVSGGLITVALLWRGLSGLQIRTSEFGLKGELVMRILRIGIPSAAEGAIFWTGQFLFLMLIARLAEGHEGKAIYAAHIIGVRIEALTYLPASAWGAAAATMVGQALGGSKFSRARKVGHVAVLQCGGLSVLLLLLFYFGAEQIFAVMHKDALVGEVGISALKMLAFFQPFLAISIIYNYCLRGAGDTRSPMFISAFGVILVRLPLAYIFGIKMHGGLIGAWIGMCADMTVRALLSSFRYTGGKWLGTRV